MDATADELAGVVDLFGGLTRAELADALSEAAYRAGGQEVDADAADDAVADALDAYALVEYEPPEGEESLLVPGPTAFPTVPRAAEDLPHILDVAERRIDRAAAGEQAVERFRAETGRAVAEGDDDRIRTLLDVSYDLEAWAPVTLDDVRERLDDELDGD